MNSKKLMQIEVGEEKYLLGFPTRADAYRAEDEGLDIVNGTSKLLRFSSKLIYTGLLAKQPNMTEEKANEIIDEYIEEGGELEEIISFLSEQYSGFMKSQNTSKKKKKKAKIVTI